VGSTNQQFHFLTARYAHLAEQLGTLADRIEVRVDQHGLVSVNGWASTDALDLLLDGVGTQRAAPRRAPRGPSRSPPA
jgi:anaerobic ribonucleoside-triphosphate reductase activating protein